MNWRQNPQRVGWIILIANLCACCILAIAGPLGVRSFLLHATRSRPAYVAAMAGTAQLWTPRADDATAVTEQRAVTEGSQIVTDNTAKALLTVASDKNGDQVLATIQLLENTALALERARTPRFDLSSDPDQIVLSLRDGRILIATQATDVRDVRVQLTTPQAVITFGSGTFAVMIEDDQTKLRARSGTADVLAAGTEVTAHSGDRVSVATGRAPDLPVPDAFNLVLNGEFVGELGPAWQEWIDVGEGLPKGKITLETDGQRRVVRFTRRAEDGAPNVTGIRQTVDRDVQGYDSLVFRMDLKLLYQSVPGGGYLASEYPVMVDIFYTDIYGKDLHWYQGFYYMDLPSGTAYLQPTGDKIPLGVWYAYESTNLFSLLKETRPARINTVNIYASGHDYDSMISDVALSAR